MGVKHRVLPDRQLPTVALTEHGKPCGQEAKDAEMVAAAFTKMVRDRTFTFEILYNYTMIVE